MCATTAARSVAPMRLTHLIVATAAAAAATLAAAPTAFAADAVYGGSTDKDDPIVVRADPQGQELRSLGHLVASRLRRRPGLPRGLGS